MGCTFVGHDGWKCPDPPAQGKELCFFHDPDWAAKPSELFAARLLERADSTPSDQALRCDGWICPDLTLGQRIFKNSLSFRGAKFRGLRTDFSKVEFLGRRTDFSHAEFDGDETSFMSARFNGQETTFSRARFLGQRTDFRYAMLARAQLLGASLNGADVAQTDLENADLRGVTGLIPSNTFVRGARFDERATDPWSVLRRNYTGIMFVLHLILLAIFLAPYVVRAAMLLGVNRAQTSVQRAVDLVAAASAPSADQVPTAAQELGSQAGAEVSRITPCLAPACEPWALYQVLLGWDRARLWAVLVGVLIFYNGCRATLTYHVSLMREAEERSGYSPRWREREERVETSKDKKVTVSSPFVRALISPPVLWFMGGRWTYRWLFRLHQVSRLIALLALVSFAAHLMDWLSRPVWLPK